MRESADTLSQGAEYRLKTDEVRSWRGGEGEGARGDRFAGHVVLPSWGKG